jgi:hypothetical protein
MKILNGAEEMSFFVLQLSCEATCTSMVAWNEMSEAKRCPDLAWAVMNKKAKFKSSKLFIQQRHQIQYILNEDETVKWGDIVQQCTGLKRK